ncbi:exodeoxyribonuclease V subunit gamma [Rheinheimera sp.]|uniref:exodeoxyribonuclease V subunit gamma n=1 Tax=Rheinheimera sp. TaxID=1869214 RepID=UPI00307E297E
MTMSRPSIEPGFLVVHSNQLEQLRALVVQFCKAYPLQPLELEHVLVQSNGIAQWLKLALAADPDSDALGGGLGIAAAVQMQLPGRFVWHMYQQALPELALSQQSVFDKGALRWRLYQLLPLLLAEQPLGELNQLNWQDPEVLAGLSHTLADLFDQYQVYRADWLNDWAAGHAVLRQSDGTVNPMPDNQLWQARLWQALMHSLPAQEQQHSRAVLHQQFLQRARQWTQRPAFLPRRVIVFGISSLPQQSLELLSAIAPFCQVLLAVLNPCQLYWADAIAEKDRVRVTRHRQQQKLDFAALPAELAAMQTQPLLASWGKQGRDYIRLLDQFDETAAHQHLFNQQRVDLFVEPDVSHLLGQLQSDILNLRSPQETKTQWPALTLAQARTIEFHSAHSALREVEILHDQLLQRFAEHPTLKPRDVMVMVPDIQVYAPFIQAVFGRVPASDNRYIPFSISDQAGAAQQPLRQALQLLLYPEQQRLSASSVFDLLDLSTVQQRFGLAATSLPTLKVWLEQAGVRWGLNEAHRAELGLTPAFTEHSWWYGLKRMLLGYVSNGDSWQGIMPFTDSAGLEAAELGPLCELFDALELCWQQLRQQRTVAQWVQLFSSLLQQFFSPTDLDTEQELQQLQQALMQWQHNAELAQCEVALPLQVARQAWLDELQGPGLQQRFITGRVNFATLLPMRAIPFEIIALLGMNDGDYPRRQPRADFDLLARDYRAGDRSRRDDDRYLLLEALLSARSQLYISWVGQNVLDNASKPPSVLVMQLRDHLQNGWQLAGVEDPAEQPLLQHITFEHPLHSYSSRYLAEEGGLFSYRHEWQSLHQAAPLQSLPAAPLPLSEAAQWGLPQLSDFLRAPVKFFFRQRLKLDLDSEHLASLDDEDFVLQPLQRYQLQQQLLTELRISIEQQQDWQQACRQCLDKFSRQGLLGVGAAASLAQQDLSQGLPELAIRLMELCRLYPELQDLSELEFQSPDGSVRHLLSGLRRGATGLALVQLVPVGLYAKAELNVRAAIPGYLLQLLCSACGVQCSLYLLSRQGELCLPPYPPQRAEQQLRAVLHWLRQGLSTPLALELKTALEALKQLDKAAPLTEAALQKLSNLYHGDGFNAGVLQYDRYLQRAWPDFNELWQQGQLVTLAESLYRPLLCLGQGDAA